MIVKYSNFCSFFLFWVSCLSSFAVYAVDPALDWRTLESQHFQVHYAKEHKNIANHVAVIAETVHQRLSKELNWEPEDKTSLVLSDETDFANGFATPLNFNRSVLFMAPPSGVGGLEDFDDWLTLLITHEYTHIIHLDKANGGPEKLRSIFGRFIFLFPNIFQPAWMIEGLATHKETDLERKIGRGQSTIFAMMMRMEVEHGIKPVSQVNLPITTPPGGATRYLYGVHFMQFVAEEYSEEKLQELIEAYSRNILPFFINTTFKKVFSKDVTAMWGEFESWLERKYRSKLDQIRPDLKHGEAITQAGFSHQPVRVAGGKVYFIRTDGSYQPELVRWRENTTEVISEVHRGTDFDVHENSGLLLSQLEFCSEFLLYRDLYLLDENTGDMNRITECGRYLRAVWYPDGKHILAVHHEAGKFELHRLNVKGEIQEIIWKSQNDTVLSQIDISPDGQQLVAALWRKGQGWNLEFFNLETMQWRQLTHNTKIQSFPEYAADGKSVYYSYDHDGVFNLYRYDIATKIHTKITNVIGGAFQPVQGSEQGPLYYVSYSASGTDIYRLDDINDIAAITLEENEKLKPYNYEEKEFSDKEYSAWPNLRPRWWFPHLAISGDKHEYGFTTAGNDALGLHNYALTAAYETKNDVPLGSFAYRYSNWLSFFIERDNSIFRDQAGNFNRVRSSNELFAVLAFPNTHLLSASNILFALGAERHFDNKLATGATPAPDFKDNTVGAAWLYNNSRRYPFSISPNDGRRIRLVAEDSNTLDSDFTGQVYTFQWREFIRLGGEHVLAFRALYGWGTEQPDEFRLGGEETGIFFNAFLEASGEPVFSVREYALRGYKEGLPQLRGRRAQLYSAEWRFPLERLERGLMAPPIGLMQWSGSVFVDTGAAYRDSHPQEFFTGAGFEINADLNLFYGIPVRTRLGYAHGFDDIGDDRVYFELGASF